MTNIFLQNTFLIVFPCFLHLFLSSQGKAQEEGLPNQQTQAFLRFLMVVAKLFLEQTLKQGMKLSVMHCLSTTGFTLTLINKYVHVIINQHLCLNYLPAFVCLSSFKVS